MEPHTSEVKRRNATPNDHTRGCTGLSFPRVLLFSHGTRRVDLSTTVQMSGLSANFLHTECYIAKHTIAVVGRWLEPYDKETDDDYII